MIRLPFDCELDETFDAAPSENVLLGALGVKDVIEKELANLGLAVEHERVVLARHDAFVLDVCFLDLVHGTHAHNHAQLVFRAQVTFEISY